ncbi:AIPR family protein [Chromobacterium violaceum]|nr:AIPR family protein [Chromobacterium violaceum]
MESNDYPDFLSDYGSLIDHLNSQMEDLSTTEKGDKFATLAEYIVPNIDFGIRFEKSKKSKKSWDKGVDIRFQSIDSDKIELRIQSKFTISKVDDIDSIISKFSSYDTITEDENAQQNLNLDLENCQPHQYLIFTTSKIENLIKLYEKSQRPSLKFYEKIKENNLFHTIQGEDLLTQIRSIYRQAYVPPKEIRITLSHPFIQEKNVFIGVTKTEEVKRIYKQTGDSIFFENIREWLGVQGGKLKSGGKRETVNEAIASTLEESPEKMLERNNGMTFKATAIKIISDSIISLENPSIVNGCQTTMSIVSSETANAHVLLKCIETEDSWEIAKAANFQNPIERVELELARYIRPQLLKYIGAKGRFKVTDSNQYKTSAFSLLSNIHRDEVIYEEVKSVFIGLFSRLPNNAIGANYTDLRFDMLSDFENDENKSEFIEALFAINIKSTDSIEKLDQSIQNNDVREFFKRFWDDNKPSYRATLGLLSIFKTANIKKDEVNNYQTLKNKIITLAKAIDASPTEFSENYINGFKIIAIGVLNKDEDKNKILQGMYKEIRGLNFETTIMRMSII